MSTEGEEIVIIGAGICGLATALALHKKGITGVVVMEKSQSLRNDSGTAIGVQANGWRALDQLGVGDTLRHTARPLHRTRVTLLDGGRQKEISFTPSNGEARCLRRKDLIDTLYAALPPETVKFGCKLESLKLDPHSSKPVLRFADGRSIVSKVVIGCDGDKSVIANFLNLKRTQMYSSCSVRGLTKYPNGHSFNYELAIFKTDKIAVGRLPIDDNLVYWFCSKPYLAKDENHWEDPELIRQSTLELLTEQPQENKEMIENADMKSLSVTRLRYRAPWDLLTGSFCKGTVVVAGDAMHVMGPFLGQGGSAGLEDAIVLARTMARFGLNRVEGESKVTVHGVEKAFNRFVKERRMRVVWLSLQTYLTGMLWSASSRLKKIMYVMLLVVFFNKPDGHTDYDCGEL